MDKDYNLNSKRNKRKIPLLPIVAIGLVIVFFIAIITMYITISYENYKKNEIEPTDIKNEVKEIAKNYIEKKYNFVPTLNSIELEEEYGLFSYYYTGAAKLEYTINGKNFQVYVNKYSGETQDNYQMNEIEKSAKDYINSLIGNTNYKIDNFEIDGADDSIDLRQCNSLLNTQCFSANEYFNGNITDFLNNKISLNIEISFSDDNNDRRLIQISVFDLISKLSSDFKGNHTDLEFNIYHGDEGDNILLSTVSINRNNLEFTFFPAYGTDKEIYLKMDELAEKFNYLNIKKSYKYDIKINDEFSATVDDINTLNGNYNQYNIKEYNDLSFKIKSQLIEKYNCKSIKTYEITTDLKFPRDVRNYLFILYYNPKENSNFIFINYDLTLFKSIEESYWEFINKQVYYSKHDYNKTNGIFRIQQKPPQKFVICNVEN
jgi:hypothetical protein